MLFVFMMPAWLLPTCRDHCADEFGGIPRQLRSRALIFCCFVFGVATGPVPVSRSQALLTPGAAGDKNSSDVAHEGMSSVALMNATIIWPLWGFGPPGEARRVVGAPWRGAKRGDWGWAGFAWSNGDKAVGSCSSMRIK